MKRFLSIILLVVALSATAWAQCDPGQTDCSITVTGHDQYSDGWNGASLAIYQDTILRGTFTLTSGSYFTQTFPACSGPISFVWTGGLYDSECSFTITDSLGVVLYNCTSASGLSGAFATSFACPSCLPPMNIVSTPMSDSAIVSWSLNEDAMGYFYQCRTGNYPTGTWEFTTDTTILLTNLSANTEYNLFVRTYCGVEDTSTIALHTFRTLCGMMTVPFSEGFENYGAMPACWTLWEHTAYNSYGYMYYYPQINSYNNHSGNYCLDLYSDYGPNSIVSPLVPLPANQVEMTFWAFGNYGYIQVGYTFTDDSATAVFHPVENVALSDVYQLYTVSFDTVNTTDSVYVVLRVANNPSYTYIYLDDITIRQRRSCPLVDSLTVVESAHNQVTLGWVCPSATAWEVAYGPTGFNPDEDTTRVAVTTNPTTITGLSDSMVYDFYVRSVCATENGYWSLPVTAQPNVYNMHESGDDTIFTCGMAIADPGGVAANAPYYSNSTLIVYPDDSTMSVSLSGFVNLGGGSLDIYEGAGTDGRQLAHLTGSNSNVEAVSYVGPITLVLNTSYYSYEGFLFYTQCVPLATCTPVYNVAMSNISARSATISWSYDNHTTPSEFNIILTDTANENVLTFVAPDSARSMMLTGLSHNTNYLLDIHATCDGGDTSENVSLSFLTPCLAGGEVLIGDATSTSSSAYLPDYTYYNNSYSQQIFDSTEVAGFDSIFGLKINMVSGLSSSRQIDVYIDTTSRSSYSAATDLVPQTMANRYFSGTFTVSSGWNELRFDSAYVYPGHGNIIVTFDDNTGSYFTSYSTQSHSTTEPKSIYAYADNVNFDPSDSTTIGSVWGWGIMSERTNMIFITPCVDATCVAPNVTVANVDSSSVSLVWVPGLYEAEWSVEYTPVDDINWQFHTSATSLDSAIVSGLTPATAYRFRIGSLCGDTTVYTTVEATTACAPLSTIPLVENFDNFTADFSTDAMQRCWGRYTNYSSEYSTYFYPYIYDYSGYARSGYSLYFGSYVNNYYSQLILPEMAVPVDTLQVSFYIMGTYTAYYTYKLKVGVQTDPYNPSTFVAIDSAAFSMNDYDWQLVEVDLSRYTGNGRFICIRTDEDESDGFYLDDLRVDYVNPCKKPINLYTSNATTHSIELFFTDTNNVGNYTVFYGTVDSLADATDSVNITASPYTLDSLTHDTEYHAWLRVNCGAGLYSSIVEFPAFHTRCFPIVVNDTVSYDYDFEPDLDPCMNIERIDGRIDWEWATTTYNPAGAYSGGHIAQFYGGSRTGSGMLILPTFDFSALTSNAELTFYLAQVASGDAQDKLYVAYRLSNNTDWIVIDSFTNNITSWTRQYVSLPASAGNANYQTALIGVSNMGNGVKIDELSVHAAPTCARPTGLTVTAVTNSTADITWNNSAPSYEVRYRIEGSWSWHRTVVHTNSVTLTDLQNLSNYQVCVRALCSAYDRSEWCDNASFVTNACIYPIVHYNYDPATAVPALSNYAPSDGYYPYTYSEVIVDASTLAGLDNIIAIGFNPTNTDVGSHYGNADIYIGSTTDTVLNNFKFDSSFVHVFHGSLNYASTGWKYFRLDTAYAYDGTSNLVVAVSCYGGQYGMYGSDAAFEGHVNNCVKTLYAQDYSGPINPFTAASLPVYSRTSDTVSPNYVFLSCGPFCEDPEIVSTSATSSSVSLGWNAGSRNAEICYKQESESDWSDPIQVDGYSYTVTGLNHSTVYQFRIRQNCNADSLGYSNWVFASETTGYVCNVPTNVQVANITNSRATVSWTAAPTDDAWEVRVFNNSFDQTFRATTTSFEVTGLTAGERYLVQVRTLCGPLHGVVGDFTESVEFYTLFCGAVGAVTAEVHGNAVKLTWVPGDYNQFWEVQYGRQGYAPNEVLGTVLVPDTHAFITNLVPNFTYGFRVRALCGLNWNSDWTGNEVVVTTGERTGIDDADQNFECSIYPNPAKDMVSINVAGVDGRITISVVDINGRTVASETLECSSDCNKQMDVSGLSQGAYYVRIVGDNVNSVRKLIVK